MSYSQNSVPSERFEVVALGQGTASSTPLDTSVFYKLGDKNRRLVAIFILGNMANETIDCILLKASTTTGTGAASLKTSTQLAASATVNDKKIVIINLESSELLADTAKQFVGARITTGAGTGGICSIIILAFDGRQAMDAEEIAAVLETIN